MPGGAFRISGRVQGVGFRWWTARTAKRLGLAGHVRNEPDGTVVVVAWGEPASIDELEDRLRDGPAGARVDAVERLEAPEASAPDGFTIG